MNVPQTEGFTTQLLHHDRRQAGTTPGATVHASTCNSVLFGYDDVSQLCDLFQGKSQGYTYARQSTPSTQSLQSLVSLTEAGSQSLCFATGMAAISALVLGLLKTGDHMIASRYLFGNTYSLFTTLERYGINVSFVDTCDANAVAAAIEPNTRLVFTETIANPGTQIPDFEGINSLCTQHGLLFAVDNTLATGYLFQPKHIGAHFVIVSLTKSFNGHGHVLGGALVDTGGFDWQTYPNITQSYRKGDPALWGMFQIRKKVLRDMGPTLSAESASRISIGLETLALRLERACANAQALAHWLNQHPKVAKVYHPSLPAHPQHQRAKRYFRHHGALLSLDLQPHYDPIAFLNSMELVINATHLGDNRTLALPVAKTIFHEMGPANRQAQGIAEAMIRCSIGIEDQADLLACFQQALAKLE